MKTSTANTETAPEQTSPFDLCKYRIYQRKVGGTRWWPWPFSSYFKQRTINFAKRLRAVADGRYEYKIKKEKA